MIWSSCDIKLLDIKDKVEKGSNPIDIINEKLLKFITDNPFTDANNYW